MHPGRAIVVALASLTLLVVLLASATVVGGAADAGNLGDRPAVTALDGQADQHSPTPTIELAYPNPIADGDAGEFLVVSTPPGTATLSMSDGTTEVVVDVPPDTPRVALTATPNATENLTEHPVVHVPDLALANAGESLILRANETVVDRATYRNAPEGEVVTWNGTRAHWRSLGATDRPVAVAGPGTVRAFVLPDAAGLPSTVLAGADDRILLAGYTLSSESVVEELVAAHRRGATVSVLLEGEPIGGRSRREAALLDRLVEAGVEVRLVGGDHARYDYHHAKYAVVDDRAIVLTENWKPAGTGGNSSRGWGIVTNQPAVVANLTATFAADAGWRDAVPWERHRRGRTYERGEPAIGSFPTHFEPATVPVNRTELLVAPDNAGPRLVGLLDGADESVDVVQASLGDWDEPLPMALRRAARRDVPVRLLLSSAWYVREENRRTVARFREWAERTGAPLTARLAEPAGRYEKIHAKGAIVDDAVVLGSLNWNEQATTSNREVLVVLHGERVAAYYERVFDADWEGGGSPFPVGLLAGVGGAVAVAGVTVARLRFEGDTAVGVGPPATED